jgi:hypothetical protein
MRLVTTRGADGQWRDWVIVEKLLGEAGPS